jgi:hypothetical protein
MVKLAGIYDVPEEAIAEHERFLVADKEYNKAWRDLDKYKEGTPKWYDHLNKVIPKATNDMFRAWDAFAFKVKHKDDVVPALEEDIRGVVIDSLSDKLDELEFTLNVGLLGSKVAQTIRDIVADQDMGQPPLCGDCTD